MEPFFLPASPTSPEVSFEFSRHHLSIRGESYPENAAAFYGPVLDRLRAYLALCDGQSIDVHVALAYFNSSSTKMLFALFDALNEAAIFGNEVRLHWYRDEEDETILEFGQELQDDFAALEFVDCILPAGQA
ncbi:DUF1987 domain-containing protein [Pseudoduganella umbonata]|uniref:DUF1987 domain-containing protein n=1 Tax=Pseudoduganella umbonata TaxID=864828 RepID=A0A4P8HN12_9BURK|nr:DUF1987 domain-containing protein [Pseudoduganella umbonata]MBB3219609.1 hypothetical protein [Pseudoduganella umbonata]QCP09675.1 DUF1987 domain-containing protein [Pseudoduganella umbonata]